MATLVTTKQLRIVEPFRGAEDYLALVLLTHGLEDIALTYMIEHRIVPSPAHIFILPRPDAPAIGDASMDKVIVRLGADLQEMKTRVASLQDAPVIQAVLAFVVAADGLETTGGWQERDCSKQECMLGEIAGPSEAAPLSPDQRWTAFCRNYSTIPTGMLNQLAQLVSSSPQWSRAEDILLATGVGPIKRFRASCITSGRSHSGFDCTDAMKVVGGGALAAHAFLDGPGWKVDLKRFEVEVYGFVFHDSFACGLLLGGQWRRNTNEDKYSFSKVPCGERASRPYTVGDHQPWFMPRLRPSTSMLLLLLADLQPGHSLLDPMGGSGTIAIEAAIHFRGVHAVTSDNHSMATSAAIKNCVLARPHLAEGSSLKAEDWDARNLTHILDGSIDRIVTDMPFGNRCKFDASKDLPRMLSEMSRVLKPGGKAVLLMKGYRRAEAFLKGLRNAEDVRFGGDEGGDDDDEAEKHTPDVDQGDLIPVKRIFKRGKGYCRVREPIVGDVVKKHLEHSFVNKDGDPIDDALDESDSQSVGAADATQSDVTIETPQREIPRETASDTGAVLVEGLVASQEAETTWGVSLSLSIVERRPVAIGGYLCYALLLGKS